MAPNRQRPEGEGRGWIVPILSALVLGALVLGLLLGGVSLGGDTDEQDDAPPTVTEPGTTTDTAEGAPTVGVTGPPQAIARHAQRD